MAIIIEKIGSVNYDKVQCDECKSILKYINTKDEKETYNPDGYLGPESFFILNVLFVEIKLLPEFIFKMKCLIIEFLIEKFNKNNLK